MQWNPSIQNHACMSPADLQLEIRVLDICIKILKEQNFEFVSSYADDEEYLKEDKGMRYYWAVLYRMGVKKCIIKQI